MFQTTNQIIYLGKLLSLAIFSDWQCALTTSPIYLRKLL